MTVRRVGGAVLGLVCVAAVLVGPARAADILVSNNGFESGLTGWTQYGTGGNQLSTEQAYAGTRSGKVIDSSPTGATGLQSSPLPATPGVRYVAAARVLASSGKPDLYLRFVDNAGQVLGTSYTSFVGVSGSWYPIQTPALAAPAGTTRMVALLYSAKANQGTAYWDQVTFSLAGHTDLGVQVNNSVPIGTTFGIGAQQHLAYGVITSPNEKVYSAQLAEIDVNSGTAVGRGPLNGALGASVATTASDGSVYLGANVNGRLYRYTPANRQIADLGRAIARGVDSHIWSLAADTAGRVYGGTSTGAGLFTYRPGDSAITNLGSPIDPSGTNEYLRGMAYDPRPGQQAVYLGLGYAQAKLIRYDPVTRAQQDILPAAYASAGSVTGLTFTGDRLFAKVGSKLVVLAVTKTSGGAITVTVDAELTISTQEVSPALGGLVYYVLGGLVYSYDIAAKRAAQVIPAVAGPFRTNKFALVELADQANYPGKSIVAIGNDRGRALLFKYNPTSHRSVLAPITGGPALPNNISTIGVGPDGAIYSGGHLTGGLAAYEPMLGDGNDTLPPARLSRQIEQIEGMTRHKGVLYLGAYPGAHLYQLRPGSGSPDPSPLPGLGAIGQGQDRPYAMVAGDGRLFVGTTPASGQQGGALTVYDIDTPGARVIRNIVPDQSPVALAYHNGVLYGGTSIRPGYNSGAPRAHEAKLFSYHPVTGAIEEYSLPAPRLLTAVTALLVVDGKLWGFAEGFFFVFDPVSRQFTTPPTEMFPEINYGGKGQWRDARLALTSRDPGYVYGTIGDRLFKINRQTTEVFHIDTLPAIEELVTDDYGNLYYTRFERLFRYIP